MPDSVGTTKGSKHDVTVTTTGKEFGILILNLKTVELL